MEASVLDLRKKMRDVMSAIDRRDRSLWRGETRQGQSRRSSRVRNVG